MKARFVVGTLTLALTLASCGTQPSAPTTTAPQPAVTENGLAPLRGTENQNAIAGQYIVVFNKGAVTGGLSAQGIGGQALTSLSETQLIGALNLDPQGVSVQSIYSQALEGFAATLSQQNLDRLRADKRVAYIEQDQTMQADATQSNATWGLDRIDQRNLPLDLTYTYSFNGSGVTAFILDTGVNVTHSDFGGRAVWGTNLTGDGRNTDCQGHGTHVAGTVGSSTYGVAKSVRIQAVKVLGCDGKGANSWIIAGMDYVIRTSTGGRKVVNMSLGPQVRSVSDALDSAVTSLYNNNIPVALAAGNSGDDACYYSPARTPVAVTVGNSTSSDARASTSNYGSCLDIFAPGTSITSTWIGSNTATNTISGTSMASPHVAGAMAVILSNNPSLSAGQVTSALVNNSTPSKITGASGSPNRLLYLGYLNGGTTPTPTPEPTPTPTPTPGGTYTGSVSSGATSYQPGSAGFSYAGGTITGKLTGPSGTDFDLYLQRQGTTGLWFDVASSESSGSSESISSNVLAGTYRWAVKAYSGSGSYTLTETK